MRPIRLALVGVCASVCATVCATPIAAQEQPYYDIGVVHYPVATDVASAQQWFDRGLAMCCGFNHEEAVRCFEQAIVADPGMPMAYWGMAYAWGPNINNMEITAEQMVKAEMAVSLAQLLAPRGNELERRLIDALAKRYTSPAPEDREPLNTAYAEALQQIYTDRHDDPLVALLFAESLMNLQPWKHWTKEGVAAQHTAQIIEVLEAAMKRWPDHPGFCHFYIHMMEASPTPRLALAAADKLRDATPGVGHLLHMPSHIDIWLGNYEAAIAANHRGIAADNEFLRRQGPLNFYSLYRIHNYHFLTYAAMFDGQSNVALAAAREIPKQIPEAMLREQVDFLDAFMPTELHVFVRFGKWDAILASPEPADYLPMSRSIWRYARAIAYASTDRVDEAEREYQAFLEAKTQVPETSYLFQNPSQEILKVAQAMMQGEIAYRRGQHEQAFSHLRSAVKLDDALNYDEPWGWMQPARHALGALLVEQRRYDEALVAYTEDLKQHPKNPWALHGMAECLTKLGRTDEAEQRREEYRVACQRSDVEIDRSCYCRLLIE